MEIGGGREIRKEGVIEGRKLKKKVEELRRKEEIVEQINGSETGE